MSNGPYIAGWLHDWIFELFRGSLEMKLELTSHQLAKAKAVFTPRSMKLSKPEAEMVDYEQGIVKIDAHVRNSPQKDFDKGRYSEGVFMYKGYMHLTEEDSMFDNRFDVKVPFDVSDLEITEERVENHQGEMEDVFRIRGEIKAITS